MTSTPNTPSATNTPAMPRLKVEDLSLSWEGKPVCEHITFAAQAGQVVCMVGRSGTGKTTIFHAVAGLTQPDSGRVLLDDEDITGKAGKISYMLQKDLLLEQHTIIDNVAMPLTIGGMATSEAREQAAKYFAEFGLAGSEKQYPFQLSGGMRQRAALLRTYLTGNNVALMDEPFSALDAFTRAEMRTWFLETLDKIDLTVVLITHDIDEAIAIADRILVLAGNPAQGQVSTIVGSVDISTPRATREQFMLTDEGLAVKREVLALLNGNKQATQMTESAQETQSIQSTQTVHTTQSMHLSKAKSAGKSRGANSAGAKGAKFRDINEDDDGYHPYADRPETRPLFERDPWA